MESRSISTAFGSGIVGMGFGVVRNWHTYAQRYAIFVLNTVHTILDYFLSVTQLFIPTVHTTNKSDNILNIPNYLLG
jgi:hypothetical protein